MVFVEKCYLQYIAHITGSYDNTAPGVLQIWALPEVCSNLRYALFSINFRSNPTLMNKAMLNAKVEHLVRQNTVLFYINKKITWRTHILRVKSKSKENIYFNICNIRINDHTETAEN
jgi:hypothetical protein